MISWNYRYHWVKNKQHAFGAPSVHRGSEKHRTYWTDYIAYPVEPGNAPGSPRRASGYRLGGSSAKSQINPWKWMDRGDQKHSHIFHQKSPKHQMFSHSNKDMTVGRGLFQMISTRDNFVSSVVCYMLKSQKKESGVRIAADQQSHEECVPHQRPSIKACDDVQNNYLPASFLLSIVA